MRTQLEPLLGQRVLVEGRWKSLRQVDHQDVVNALLAACTIRRSYPDKPCDKQPFAKCDHLWLPGLSRDKIETKTQLLTRVNVYGTVIEYQRSDGSFDYGVEHMVHMMAPRIHRKLKKLRSNDRKIEYLQTILRNVKRGVPIVGNVYINPQTFLTEIKEELNSLLYNREQSAKAQTNAVSNGSCSGLELPLPKRSATKVFGFA